MIRVSLAIGVIGLGTALVGAQTQSPVFRTDTDAVTVNVSVKQGNMPVPGLGIGDFRLYDNGVLQELTAVSVDAVPVDVSLVVNTYQWHSTDLDKIREAVRGITALVRPSDRYRVLTMGNAVINAIPWRDAGPPDTAAISVVAGHVSLQADAMLMALLHRTPPDRRHLVVALTDKDNDACSLASPDSLTKAAERSGAVFHWVSVRSVREPKRTLGEPNTINRPLDPGVRAYCRGFEAAGASTDLGPALSEAVRQTGGTVHTAWYEEDRIAVKAFDEIFNDFRHSYVLHYAPKGVERTGFHRLRVEMPAKGYTLRARPGYWATSEAPSATATPAR